MTFFDRRRVRATQDGSQRLGVLMRRGRRGIAIILVLSMLLILVVITTGFAAYISQDMKDSQTAYEQTETYFLAESGIDYAMFLIKHSLTVYPAPPVHSWLTPTTSWLDGRNTTKGNWQYQAFPAYNGEVNPNAAGGVGAGAAAGVNADPGPNAQAPGSLISLQDMGDVNNPSLGEEMVVVSDLAYAPSFDWLNAGKYCGTFQVKQNVSGAGPTYTINITSTGFIKKLPPTLNGPSQPNDYHGSANFTIVAQRTLFAQATVYVGNSPGSQRIQLQVFSEAFR